MAESMELQEGEEPDRIREAFEEAMATRSPDDPVRRAWTLVSEGGMGAVRTAVTSLPESGDADAAIHRFLLFCVAGEPRSVTLTPIRRALAEGLPVAGNLLALLDAEELSEIIRSPEARWENLSRQVEEDASATLFRMRCHDSIARDEVSVAAADLEHPGFETEAATRPVLDLAAREVLSLLAWEDPDRTVRLASLLGPVDAPSRHLAALLEAGVRCASQRSRFMADHPDLVAFDRFLRLAPASPVESGVAMARELGADFAEKPGRYARALLRLSREGPDLFAHYTGLVGPLHRPDTNQVRVDRHRAEILRMGEAALRSVPFRRLSVLMGHLLRRKGAGRIWDSRLQEPLAVALADHPAAPDEVAEGAGRWTAPCGMRAFRQRIRSDEVLWAIWWTASLRHAGVPTAATGA